MLLSDHSNAMSVGIMQPYFLPYVGYFQLMQHVDQWVIFDQIQFIDKGWINRNRILHPDAQKQWQFLTLPLYNRKQFSSIDQLELMPDPQWKKQLSRKIDFFKKRAPFFNNAKNLLEECLSHDESSLSGFVSNSIKVCCSHLKISTPIYVQSECNFELGEISHAGQWALEIAKAMGANSYVNPLSGHELFRQEEFDRDNIELSFIKSKITPYRQGYREFVPGLSILDLVMWNDDDSLQQMIKSDFEIVSKQQAEALAN